MKLTLLILTAILVGCASRQKDFIEVTSESTKVAATEQARDLYEDGSYYKSRKQVQAVLEEDSHNEEAQKLMAQILEKEIARQKEHLSPRSEVHESRSSDDSDDQIKTWLERSRSLLKVKQYDMALFAAEKVFIYDPTNTRASNLIDEIRDEAIREGKADTLFLNSMYEEEIAGRIERYHGESKELMEEGKVGQAKFTLQKILLLEPENQEANRLYKEVQKMELA